MEIWIVNIFQFHPNEFSFSMSLETNWIKLVFDLHDNNIFSTKISPKANIKFRVFWSYVHCFVAKIAFYRPFTFFIFLSSPLKSRKYVVAKSLQIWTSLGKNVCHVFFLFFLDYDFLNTIKCFDRTTVNSKCLKSKK